MKLASLFQNHAALQRDLPLPIWGRGEPGERVTVRLAGHEIIGLLERQRPFFDALHSLVPEGSLPSGVRVIVHPSSGTSRRMPEKAPRWTGWLPNLGIPISHDGRSPWTVLCGQDAAGLSDEEVDSVLKQGALLDAAAVEELGKRGFSERIGVEVGPAISLDDLGYEEFLDKANRSFAGRCLPLRVMVAPGDWRKLVDLTGRAQVASVIRNYKQEAVGAAVMLAENGSGERFGILAWSGAGARCLFENRMRAEQLREIFGWVARRPLPVAVLPETPFVWPIVNRSAEGNTVLGLVNLSADPYEKIALHVGWQTPPGRIQMVDKQGNLCDVEHEFVGADAQTLTVGVSLPPMGVAALLFEK